VNALAMAARAVSRMYEIELQRARSPRGPALRLAGRYLGNERGELLARPTSDYEPQKAQERIRTCIKRKIPAAGIAPP